MPQRTYFLNRKVQIFWEITLKLAKFLNRSFFNDTTCRGIFKQKSCSFGQSICGCGSQISSFRGQHNFILRTAVCKPRLYCRYSPGSNKVARYLEHTNDKILKRCQWLRLCKTSEKLVLCMASKATMLFGRGMLPQKVLCIKKGLCSEML